jgi:anti-sigma factor RsiW
MSDCQRLDPLVTPYIDDQLSGADRRAVEAHLRACAPCHSRVGAERAVRELIHAQKAALDRTRAPDGLHAQCCALAALAGTASATLPRAASRTSAPATLAALLVGGALLHQLTGSSSRVLAAELTADHMKCFAMNGLLHTHDGSATVERSMLSGFGWRMRVPGTSTSGLELVGSRLCLYSEGKIAHIMYRHNGEPVSLFMLPRSVRAQEVVQVLGHEAAIWCAGDRTFVLVAREPREEVERMASVVQASLR